MRLIISFLLLFLLLKFAQNNKNSVNQIDLKLNHAIDCSSILLSENIQNVLKESGYSEFVLDTLMKCNQIKIDNFCLFYKKLNINTFRSNYIEKSVYLVGLYEITKNKLSKDLFFFDKEVFEFSDSNSNPSIQLLTYPRFNLINIDEDKVKELQIKQRVFNGTFYHAVIDYYFEIDTSKLVLNFKFPIESLSYLPLNNCYIKREISKNHVKVYLSQEKTEPGKLIGEYTLEYNKKRKMFISNKIKIYNTDFKDLITTSSPTRILPNFLIKDLKFLTY